MKNLTKIIALLLVFASLFSLAACGGDNKKTDDETKKETTAKVEEETTGEDTTAEDTTAEDTTTEDTTAEDTTVADTTVAQTTAPQVQQQTQQTTPPSTSTPTPELGKGSKNDPYLEIPVVGSGSMSVTTVAVPAGKSLFYNIYRVGGMVVTINNANAYIICDGKRYDAQGGVVTFVAPVALASDAISFEIGNKGGSAASFTIVFTNLVGTQANPYVIKTMGSTTTVSLSAGDSDGYNYKYKAEKAGTIRFYISANVASILTVTNNRNSSQRTTDSDSQTDANGTYVEMEVQAGDELIIIVGAAPDKRNKFPATTINWYGKYI